MIYLYLKSLIFRDSIHKVVFPWTHAGCTTGSAKTLVEWEWIIWGELEWGRTSENLEPDCFPSPQKKICSASRVDCHRICALSWSARSKVSPRLKEFNKCTYSVLPLEILIIIWLFKTVRNPKVKQFLSFLCNLIILEFLKIGCSIPFQRR